MPLRGLHSSLSIVYGPVYFRKLPHGVYRFVAFLLPALPWVGQAPPRCPPTSSRSRRGFPARPAASFTGESPDVSPVSRCYGPERGGPILSSM